MDDFPDGEVSHCWKPFIVVSQSFEKHSFEVRTTFFYFLVYLRDNLVLNLFSNNMIADSAIDSN